MLLNYQKHWISDESQVKVIEKSRRIGLSWSEAADDVLLAARRNGMDVWYIGYNKDMALEFIEDCAEWARHYGKAASLIEEFVVVDEDKDILAFRIRFASGFKIVALSSRPSNLRGKQGKVVIDEAAFHDDLDGLIKAAIALLMWGGRVVIISTHNGDENYFNEIINDVRSGKLPYSLHRVTLDDALEDGLYQRVCQRLGTEWSETAQAKWRQDLVDFYKDHADEELFCVPAKGGGVFLPRMLVQSCMDESLPVIRLALDSEFTDYAEDFRKSYILDWCEENIRERIEALPEAYPTYFGEDFGRTGDLTVLMPLQEEPLLKYYSPFVIELRNVPFRQQEQILFYMADRLPRFMAAALDARGNGEYLAEVARQRYGQYRIEQVKLTENWYRENMPKYKAAYEDHVIRIPMDGDILDDHRAIQMIRGVAKLPDSSRAKGRDGLQRHGDAAIAGAMAWFAVNNVNKGPIEFESTGKRRDSARLDSYMRG